MDTNLYSFDDVKKAINMRTVLESYGIKVSGHRNIPCISKEHTDKHPSMRVGDTNCYCFSCKANMSVIDVVMEFENVDSKQACQILNERFNLNLTPIHRVAYEDNLPISAINYAFLGLEKKDGYYYEKYGENNTPIHYGLRELYAEDKMLYYEILNDKLLEKIESIKEREETARQELAESLSFLNKCDIPNNLTNAEYLDTASRHIFTVNQHPEVMKSIETDKKIANELTKQMYKFYKREIKPLEDKLKQAEEKQTEKEEEIER